jgi:hypothetical protein
MAGSPAANAALFSNRIEGSAAKKLGVARSPIAAVAMTIMTHDDTKN